MKLVVGSETDARRLPGRYFDIAAVPEGLLGTSLRPVPVPVCVMWSGPMVNAVETLDNLCVGGGHFVLFLLVILLLLVTHRVPQNAERPGLSKTLDCWTRLPQQLESLGWKCEACTWNGTWTPQSGVPAYPYLPVRGLP